MVFVWLNYNMHLSYGHGVGILSAVAKSCGAEVFVYHVHSALGNPADAEKCAKDISGLKSDIVCVSSSSLEWGFAKLLAGEIKKICFAKLVIGGPHVTFCGNGNNEEGFGLFDHVVVGEGEKVIADLALGRPIKQKVIGSIIDDLDSLPFSDRESFAMQEIIDARNGIVDFITQRGCLYNCTYCSNHALRKLYGAKYLRRRSVANVIAEIKAVTAKYRCKIVFFHDDTFTLKRHWDWVAEFCAAYKKEIGLPFVINSRVGNLPEHIISLLAKAGCVEIKIGIESGDENLRKTVLNRKISNDAVVECFSAVHHAGIRTYAYMIRGVPGSTADTYWQDVNFIANVQPNIVRSTIFFPLPNTKLGNPYYHSNGEMNASMIGDKPSNIINHNDETMLGFYRFGWEINLAVGLKEYAALIRKYSNPDKIEIVEIKKDDSDLSLRMKDAGIVHYRFGSECSMLKLEDGKKSPFD